MNPLTLSLSLVTFFSLVFKRNKLKKSDKHNNHISRFSSVQHFSLIFYTQQSMNGSSISLSVNRFFSLMTHRNMWIMVFADICAIILAHYLSLCFRFEFVFSVDHMKNCLNLFLWMIPVKISAFLIFGLYKGMWRYTGIADMLNLVKANLTASTAVVLIILGINRFQGFSRSVFFIDFILTFLLTSGYRMGIRLYFDRTNGNSADAIRLFAKPRKRNLKKVLIIGAGDAGEKTLREIWNNPGLPYDVVGFADDDLKKQGLSIHGVPVLCDMANMEAATVRYGIDEIFIAIPSATGKQMRRIVDVCKASNVSFKTLPGLGELIDGKVSIKALRDINFEDLLGREPVRLDEKEIKHYLENKGVLITGAGGSIGSELCRQIIRYNPEILILVDAAEPNLHSVRTELKHHLKFSRFVSILGMVQDRRLMDQIFAAYKPQVVFHAAAYKHVPIMEENPWQAVRNNIRGSLIVMEKAIKHNAERFILVSTDKAVRPTNVMGCSKRICELVMLALNGNGTKMMGVRFGNVVGSSGSVIPLFRKQIEQGGPVTVTHPEVTRYFMSIPEASQLILQAGALGKGGEIFVLEMGTPVKIADMARDLIRLSGKIPDEDVEIVFTSLRPGEKLYEELITEGEGIVATEHEKITVLRSDGDFNGCKSQDEFKEWIYKGVQELSLLSEERNAESIKKKLKELVPEYTPDENTVSVI